MQPNNLTDQRVIIKPEDIGIPKDHIVSTRNFDIPYPIRSIHPPPDGVPKIMLSMTTHPWMAKFSRPMEGSTSFYNLPQEQRDEIAAALLQEVNEQVEYAMRIHAHQTFLWYVHQIVEMPGGVDIPWMASLTAPKYYGYFIYKASKALL